MAIATILAGLLLAADPGATRYLRYADVQAAAAAFRATEPDTSGVPGADSFDSWVRARDRQIRQRIDRGVEDSISNLILFGASFTTLPRVPGAEEATSADGALTPAAQLRVTAFAASLAGAAPQERIEFAGAFLKRRGVASSQVEPFLSANLRRFSIEQRKYQEQTARTGDPAEVLFRRGTLFAQRGLSADTSLLPGYAIEDTLRVMLEKRALRPGMVHRIAIVGPGLDFTDKRDGYDFYPVQTVQPFAMVEAALRLGLAAPAGVDITAFDLNPAVLAHVRSLAARAQSGKAYRVELPRDTGAGWNDEAIGYWRRFGEKIGAPTEPLPVPDILRRSVVTRAVAIAPRYASRLQAADLNVVLQTRDEPRFDLIVATNVLVYYNRFEQVLAMASIAHMLNPGGIFIANQVLPAEKPRDLDFLGRRSVWYTPAGTYGDDVVVYRKQ